MKITIALVIIAVMLSMAYFYFSESNEVDNKIEAFLKLQEQLLA